MCCMDIWVISFPFPLLLTAVCISFCDSGTRFSLACLRASVSLPALLFPLKRDTSSHETFSPDLQPVPVRMQSWPFSFSSILHRLQVHCSSPLTLRKNANPIIQPFKNLISMVHALLPLQPNSSITVAMHRRRHDG